METTTRTQQPATDNIGARAGRAKTGILLWLLGVPIPVIILIMLVRGCA